MEKLIFVLRHADDDVTEQWCSTVRTSVAEQIAATGVRGVTIYVRDAAVRDSLMRMTTFDPPATAVVSVWVEQSYGQQAQTVAKLLGDCAALVHGYLVTESVPLPLPDVGPVRTEGFGNIAMLRRPADLDFETWRTRWQQRHTAVAIETQATFGYTQNLVVRAVTPDAPELAAIVEEQFPMPALTEPMAWYGVTDQAELLRRVGRMVESVTSFGANRDLDTVATSRYQLTPR